MSLWVGPRVGGVGVVVVVLGLSPGCSEVRLDVSGFRGGLATDGADVDTDDTSDGDEGCVLNESCPGTTVCLPLTPAGPNRCRQCVTCEQTTIVDADAKFACDDDDDCCIDEALGGAGSCNSQGECVYADACD